jgi:hypothetical protein
LVLIESGFDPTSEAVRTGIQAILNEEEPDGGWRPLPQYDSLNWATANAIMALGEYSTMIRKLAK